MSALSDTERAFVEKASLSNQMEVALGRLAEDKAQHDEVKRFAEQLVRDHESAERALRSSIGGSDATLAQQPSGGTSAPAHPDATRRPTATGGEVPQVNEEMEQTQQKLERASGAAFDRAYLEEMVKHHATNIQEFERAAQSDNPQVRELAQRTLPTLREHLQQAQQLQQSIR